MSDLPSVYLDYAATSPLRESARNAWIETVDVLAASPGNPGSLHAGGRTARRLLEDARERLAAALGADRAEVVFTSGATESAALGIAGGARGVWTQVETTNSSLVLASPVDHPAVLEQRGVVERAGIEWALLPVTSRGVTVVDRTTVQGRLANRFLALATLGLVCSETGVIQPVEELVDSVKGVETGALVHTDATQAIGNIPVDFHRLGVDLLTLGGHKFGAPVGTGALLVKRGVPLTTDRPGGGQERQLRSGTPDVAGAVALSVAAADACADRTMRQSRYRSLRRRLLDGIPAQISLTTDATSAESIIHLCVPTVHPEVLLLEMDRAGVHVSAGSACHAGVTRPSSVIMAMGRSETEALGVLRVSLGPSTTTGDIDRFLTALPRALESAQRMDQYDQATGWGSALARGKDYRSRKGES